MRDNPSQARLIEYVQGQLGNGIKYGAIVASLQHDNALRLKLWPTAGAVPVPHGIKVGDIVFFPDSEKLFKRSYPGRYEVKGVKRKNIYIEINGGLIGVPVMCVENA